MYPLFFSIKTETPDGKRDNANNTTEFVLKRNVAMNVAHLNQERARKTLHKLIERNIQSWWD